MRRTENELDSRQVLSVIEKYNTALELLDCYDHQNMKRPKETDTVHVLTYEECRQVIARMRFGDESELFGKEKDDSFKGSIGNIYQSFGGQDIYESMEEKAANLFLDGQKLIEDYTLAALTIMIAESRPEEKEMMISVIMNCLGQTA